jgi:signal peptidase complex subunit 1
MFDDFLKSIPTHMDYVGQGRAEKLYQIIIILFGVVGLVWGYAIQQFSQTVYILGAGLTLATLLTVPPWPIFRSKPLKWQEPKPENDVSDGKSKKKK